MAILVACEFYRAPKIAATTAPFIETQFNVSPGNVKCFYLVLFECCQIVETEVPALN